MTSNLPDISVTPTSLIVADNACNDHYACSDVIGEFDADSYTCNGVYSCSRALGNTQIAYGGCNKDQACQGVSGTILVFSRLTMRQNELLTYILALAVRKHNNWTIQLFGLCFVPRFHRCVFDKDYYHAVVECIPIYFFDIH